MMERLMYLPVVASEHGADVDKLIIYVHWLMGALFVGWLGYFVYAVVRFRSSRSPKANYAGVTSHASSYVELAVAGVEAVLLLVFAVPFWAKAVDRFPEEKDAVVMNVVAEQFAWNGRLPGADGIFAKQDVKFVSAENPLGLDKADPNGKDDINFPTGGLRVPVNKPIIIRLTSKDVIHSFKVPQLRVCQDAIPGMAIPFHFKATKEGRYMITCAQLCGMGHSSMRGFFTVESQEKFEAWMKEQKTGDAPAAFE